MIRIYFPIILYQFVWLIQPTFTEERPLIFNPFTLEIYDFGDKSMTYNDGPFAIACPAHYKYELDFNRKFSLNNKSLFLRHYSSKKNDIINGIRCHGRVELAAVYYIDPKTGQKYLEFGYEVYFIKSKYTEDFNKGPSYSDFKKVIKPSAIERLIHFIFSPSVKTPTLRDDTTSENLEVGLIWISKTSLQLSESNWQANSISYSINKKVDWPATECHDYNLHKELYKKWPLDDFLSLTNQEEIFGSMELPYKDCESRTNCLKKYSLVPAYQLQRSDSKSASCTNLATVPVWSKITAPLLDHLDKFLFAVAQVVDKKLKVYSKVYGTLLLSRSKGKGREFLLMYLDPDKKTLPIPRIIVKLVVYQTHDCEVDKTLCWFQVIIVIHNGPSVITKLCEEDICERLGWEKIQYPNKYNPREKSQHIYCCEMNEKLQQILMGTTNTTFRYDDLNLKLFQRFNEDTLKLEYEGKQRPSENKMNQLFSDRKSYDPQTEWFPVPVYQNGNYIYL